MADGFEQQLQLNIGIFHFLCCQRISKPNGSPRVALAASYLIVQPGLSMEQAICLARYPEKACKSRKRQNVLQKRQRIERKVKANVLQSEVAATRAPLQINFKDHKATPPTGAESKYGDQQDEGGSFASIWLGFGRLL
jgi:hypothetical protein